MTHPTPRTDALAAQLETGYYPEPDDDAYADLARQLEIENAELVEALREMLECMKGCEVFIHSRQKINQQEGPGWIASFTDRARAALAKVGKGGN